MTEEKLKILLDNIDNLELIKRISEQDDFVIDSIITVFSKESKKIHEKHNIRIDQIMYILNSVTRLDNNYSKNTIVNAINSEVFWANRSYSEALKLFEIVENSSKGIELEVKRDALLNYKVLNNLNFEEHYKLMNDNVSNIRSKMSLIYIISNCEDFNINKEYRDKVLNLISNIMDTKCLNYLSNSYDNRTSYNLRMYYLSLKEKIEKFKVNSEPTAEELTKLENTEEEKAMAVSLRRSIKNKYKRKKEDREVNPEQTEKFEKMVDGIENVDILGDIDDVFSKKKFVSCVTKDDLFTTLSILSSIKERYLERRIAQIFLNNTVLDNRSFKDILLMIKERIDSPLLKNNIMATSILFSEVLLTKRTGDQVLELFNELKEYKKENNVVLANIISSNEIVSNLTYEEQKEEIENFKSINDIEKSNALGKYYLSSYVNHSLSKEERKKYEEEIIKLQSPEKVKAISNVLINPSFYNIDNMENRDYLLGRIECEPSNRAASYISEIAIELSRYGYNYLRAIDYIDGYTKTNIEYIDKLKEKYEVTRSINEANTIDELKSRFTYVI
jgi:hypothetical protein